VFDGLVESKLMMARNELSKSVNQSVQTTAGKALLEYENKMNKKSAQLRIISFVALSFSLVALGLAMSVAL
jgi:hypothetical protein